MNVHAINRPVAHFAGHLFIGTGIFLIFGGLSVGLALLVQCLSSIRLPELTLQTLSFVEQVILLADTVLYLSWIFISGIGLIKDMMK